MLDNHNACQSFISYIFEHFSIYFPYLFCLRIVSFLLALNSFVSCVLSLHCSVLFVYFLLCNDVFDAFHLDSVSESPSLRTNPLDWFDVASSLKTERVVRSFNQAIGIIQFTFHSFHLSCVLEIEISLDGLHRVFSEGKLVNNSVLITPILDVAVLLFDFLDFMLL